MKRGDALSVPDKRWGGVSRRFWRTLSLPFSLKATRIRVRSVVEENKNVSSTDSDESRDAVPGDLVPSPKLNSTSTRAAQMGKGSDVTNTSVVDPSYHWWEKQLDRNCDPESPCLWFSTPETAATPPPLRTNSHSQKSVVYQNNITSRLHEDIEVTETHDVKVRLPPTHPKVSRGAAPFRELITLEMTNSVSELTLRSCVAEPAAHRRMAYYAVGQHHHRKAAHGNRRCYFTGKLILHQPFYAGTLLQGVRTLVVFCLPSALELGLQTLPKKGSGLSSLSKISNDESISIETDLDVHYNVDKEMLLRILPPAGESLLELMKDAYPVPFETLPAQLREFSCWNLFSKFCFFSGLPIACDELHYKVKDVIADVVYGEEVALSNEVMKASSEAPELLTLPSTVVMAYLKQHYPQQCEKLEDLVFRRSSWERVEPSSGAASKKSV